VSDDRARPEYGEYATPEEQAKAAGQKYVPPEPVKPVEVVAPDEKEVAPPRRPTDRYITLLFLVFGAITLIESIGGDLNFVTQLRDFAASVGVTGVQVPAAAQVAGYWLLRVLHRVLDHPELGGPERHPAGRQPPPRSGRVAGAPRGRCRTKPRCGFLFR
jgi:hypothetical protein